MPSSEPDGALVPNPNSTGDKPTPKKRSTRRESVLQKTQPQLTYTPEQLAVLNASISLEESAAAWVAVMGSHGAIEGCLNLCKSLSTNLHVPQSMLVNTMWDSKRKYEEPFTASMHAPKKPKAESQHNPREMSLYNLVNLYVHKVVLQQFTHHPAVKACIDKHGQSGKIMQITGELWAQVSKENKVAWVGMLKDVLQECNKLRQGRSAHGPQPDLLAPYLSHVRGHPEHSLDYFLNLKPSPTGAHPGAAAAVAGPVSNGTHSPPSSGDGDGKETDGTSADGTGNIAMTVDEKSSDGERSVEASSEGESSVEASSDEGSDSESEEEEDEAAANGKGVLRQAGTATSDSTSEGEEVGSDLEGGKGGGSEDGEESSGSSSSEESSSGDDEESNSSGSETEDSSDSDGRGEEAAGAPHTVPSATATPKAKAATGKKQVKQQLFTTVTTPLLHVAAGSRGSKKAASAKKGKQ